ncbi:MAG TPA: DUF4397 domain-containing protein [Gemmatimonadales bacterium]|nr:DUF4397 domain-containing protein [Gemmatimonadales bacterium]
MRLSRIIIPLSALLLLASCGVDDSATVNSRPDLAGVRFINALVDAGPVDARMVDQAQWSAYALGLNFRQSGITLPTQAGARPVKVWTATNVLEDMELLIDQTVNITAGQNVTLLLTGSVAGGTARIEVIPDPVPSETAGQIHVRAVNASDTPADVSWVDGGGASAAVSVGALGTTEYVARPTGLVSASFDVVGDAGSPRVADAPIGAPEDGLIGARAGYSAEGSGLSAFVFGPAVVGSLAPQDPAFLEPGIVWFVDRIPAPPR